MDVLIALAAALTLAVPGRANSTPSVAADGSFVVVAWSASLPTGATDIFATVSRDGARSFAAAVRVNDVAGDARVNGEQPPRIALVPRRGAAPLITVVWTTKGQYGTRLVSARSDDGGRSFLPATTVAGSDAAGNRGWENIVANPGGEVFAVWLDHREMADHSMAAGHHQHGEDPAGARPASAKPDGVAMAQMSKLYVGAIDGSVPPRPVTRGVCYCCKTAFASDADGTLYAAWRHVYPGNLRDIAFTVSRDGGRTFAEPVRVSEDKWTLEGCPDDGPAIAVDGAHRVHVVWPTLITDEKTGEPAIGIFYATSADGRRFSTRMRVPTEGVAHHPQIALDSKGVPTLAWDEGANGARRVVIGSVSAAGGVPHVMRSVAGDRGVYPSLASAGSTTVVAWTASQPSGSEIRVQRVER
jgi:hypothetical protein